ncbi:hypothetical protein HPB51_003779 [Rhipicephalus microplus]|uniref:Peptidase M13 C-terminal domain-containing protein n=1 Tax=Rhipicephalus microplus TaxID=6941 RepID=A0A9J6DZV6_RHIMP|nr:hypothetical protein HPB51_003779 [Rhipicephalus microplus]
MILPVPDGVTLERLAQLADRITDSTDQSQTPNVAVEMSEHVDRIRRLEDRVDRVAAAIQNLALSYKHRTAWQRSSSRAQCPQHLRPLKRDRAERLLVPSPFQRASHLLHPTILVDGKRTCQSLMAECDTGHRSSHLFFVVDRITERQKARQELSNFYDSENLADLVGVKIAYDGFSSLPRSQRTRILSGTNITAERLYFISHCVKWCREVQFGSGRYAPDRSRCIVPLMNMPEFSKAFECAAGDLMNPTEKCGFWA